MQTDQAKRSVNNRGLSDAEKGINPWILKVDLTRAPASACFRHNVLLEVGLVQRELHIRYAKKPKCTVTRITEDSLVSVDLDGVRSLLILLLTGHVVSVLILGMELIVHRYNIGDKVRGVRRPAARRPGPTGLMLSSRSNVSNAFSG